MPPDRVIRFSADLVEDAAVEGARNSRSTKQQLDHWVRVGRAVSGYHSASRRRVEAAVAGTLPMRDLTPDERVVANAEIDAAISEQLTAVDYGAVLAAEGVPLVGLDESGQLVRYHPDGSTSVLDEPIATALADPGKRLSTRI